MDPNSPPPNPAAPPSNASAESEKKLIIIEDESMLQTALFEILSSQGYQVKVAGDGKQGLDMIYQFKPDLILLDINMPVMDGLTLLKKLREDPSMNPLRIIMLTNYNDAQKESDSINLKVDRYMVKADIKLEEVASVVHFLLFGPI